ncbi:MucBP domain-containing protein [Lapidilactobacillus luobeiensis]|uniref:MucBP domain-containing protein n=1 Tax=Lapidilactobacillus luobeiensis TaxID=2950371 RepID=UPI0021C2B8E0|nr:MucBP domain-containing protein [Lapidilactobacillus luobeiensis]
MKHRTGFALMMVLLLLTPFFALPLRLVAAASDPVASINSQIKVVDQGNGSSTVFNAGDTLLVTSNLGFGVAGDQALKNVKIKLTLPATIFEKPDFSEIQDGKAELGHDEAGDYVITYTLPSLPSGVDYGVSSKAKLKLANLGKTFTLRQQVLNESGEQLAESTFDLKVSVPQLRPLVNDQVNAVTSAQLDAQQQLLAPLSRKFPVTTSYNGNGSVDIRPIIVKLTLPLGLDFDATQESAWQYDPKTREATVQTDYLDKTSLELPYTLAQGTALTAKFPIKYQVTFANGDLYPTKDASGTATVSLGLDEVSEKKPKVEIQLLGQKKSDNTYDNNLDINDMTGMAQENIRLYMNDVTTEDKAVPVKSLRLNFADKNGYEDNSTSLKVMALALEGPITSEMKVNQVIGKTLNGTTQVLAENLTTDRVELPENLQQPYARIELVFDQTINVAPYTSKSALGLTVYGEFRQSFLDQFKQANVQSRSLSLLGSYFRDSSSQYSTGSGRADLYLKKPALPEISNASLNKDLSGSLLPGQIMLLNFELTIQYILGRKVPALKDAKIYYFLPDGLIYQPSDSAQVHGLKDITVIQNYQDSGKTVVIGTPTRKLDGDFDNSDWPNRRGEYNFTLPVRMSRVFQYQARFPLEAYLYFTNNGATYVIKNQNSTNISESYFVDSPKANPGIPQALLDLTEAPDRLAGDDSDFTFAPEKRLYLNAFVKAAANTNFVANLSQTANEQALTYRLRLFNNSERPIAHVGFINVLPVKGQDDSAFSVKMTGPVSFSTNNQTSRYSQSDFDIFYSTDAPTDVATDYRQAHWVAQPSDYSKVRMIKIQAHNGVDLKNSDEFYFDYPAVTVGASDAPDLSSVHNVFATTTDAGQTTFTRSSAAVVTLNRDDQYFVRVRTLATKTEEPLPGATFQLYRREDQQDTLVNDQVYTSNTQGEFVLSALAPGNYYLKQTKLPAGYGLPQGTNETQTNAFTVAAGQSGESILNIYNEKLPEPVAGKVTVHYQDVEGNKIADSEVLEGDVGTKYQAEKKQVADYTFKETHGADSGQFTVANQEVTFIYEKVVAQGKVTVHYQDVDGNKIADPEVLKGEVGTEYHAEKKQVADYTFKEVIGADSGQFTVADQEVTLIYEKVVAQGKVTVHYQDVDGNQIADPEVLEGDVGTKYQAEKKQVADYTFKETHGADSGQFTATNQEVTFIYEKVVAQGKVTVHYQDVEGNKIADSAELKGNVGTEYQAEKKQVADYTFKEVIGADSGQFKEAEQEVTFVYEKVVAQGKVTVHYQDVEGNKIADSEELTGNVGSKYHAEKKQVADYTFKEVIGADGGQFTVADQEVTFIYEKETPPEPDEGQVIVNYQDENGKELATAEILTGIVGTPYQTTEKMVSGHKVVRKIGVPNGTFTAGAQQVTYVYRQVDSVVVSPDEPDQPEKPATPNKVNKPQTNRPVQSAKSSGKRTGQHQLPRASEKQRTVLSWIGLSLAIVIVGVGLEQSRDRRHD